MSDVMDTWLRSKKFVVLDGKDFIPKESPFFSGTALCVARGQGTVYYLENHRNWVVKKFSPVQQPEHDYVKEIASLIPQNHLGFEAGTQRIVLNYQSLLEENSDINEQLARWLDHAILMPRVVGNEWGWLLGKARSGSLLTTEQRFLLCKNLSEHIDALEKYTIAHRDLSCDNLLVDAVTWQVNLVDWDSLYSPNVQMPANTPYGTPGYISPIVKQKGTENPRSTWCPYSDRFSLTILIVEFLATTTNSPHVEDGGIFKQQELFDRGGEGIAKILKSIQQDYPGVVQLFNQALQAQRFENCPSPQDWLRLIVPYIQLDTVRSFDEVQPSPKARFSNQKLTEIPSRVFDTPDLSMLFLDNNELVELPSEIAQLTKLTNLYLEHNLLTKLPAEIGELLNLRTLTLQGNQLTALPVEMAQLTNLVYLDLENNLLPIPPEILVKKEDPAAVIHYYLAYRHGQKHPLNEAKLVLVGQPNVGKTSLVNQLITHNPSCYFNIWSMLRPMTKSLTFNSKPAALVA